MSENKKGNFFLAGLFGAIVGAVGGLLFAPQSGKKTREEIAKMANSIYSKLQISAKELGDRTSDVFGTASKIAKQKYTEVSKAVANKAASVKKAGHAIDKGKYGKIVEDVVDEFQDDFVATKQGAKKIATQLKKDWQKVKTILS